METDRSKLCGCKGIRTCRRCEEIFQIERKHCPTLDTIINAYVHCSTCNKCWRGWDADEHQNHMYSSEDSIQLDGINVIENFLSVQEENQLIHDLNLLPWELSQSGRRKQNFGPKCNFKKRKLRVGEFKGFPECAKFIHDKFKTIDILKDYLTIEQCTLEYDPDRGASIDPHIDDCWIWGERIVTVNLLADSILTLTPYNCDKKKYNHDLVSIKYQQEPTNLAQVIRIPMRRRSLIVLAGEARYSWLHQIYREDIHSRRICLAFREFTPPYLPGGERSEEGKEILNIANQFW